MTKPSLIRAGWVRAKEYGLAVVAAALMYGGVHQFISALSYPLSGLTLQLVNTLLMRAFRDRVPLPNYYPGVPWLFHLRVAAGGMFVLIVGSMVGLWINAKGQRQPDS